MERRNRSTEISDWRKQSNTRANVLHYRFCPSVVPLWSQSTAFVSLYIYIYISAPFWDGKVHNIRSCTVHKQCIFCWCWNERVESELHNLADGQENEKFLGASALELNPFDVSILHDNILVRFEKKLDLWAEKLRWCSTIFHHTHDILPFLFFLKINSWAVKRWKRWAGFFFGGFRVGRSQRESTRHLISASTWRTERATPSLGRFREFEISTPRL